MLNVSRQLVTDLLLMIDWNTDREDASELIIVIIWLLLFQHTYNSSLEWKVAYHQFNQLSEVNNYTTRQPHSFNMAPFIHKLCSLHSKNDITTCLQSTGPKLVSQKAQYWEQQMWTGGEEISLRLWRSHFRLWSKRGKSSLSGSG